MKTGIYVVDVPAERNLHVRYVVLAGSATLARDLVGMTAPDADANAFDVGRLGDYDPGINGAGMVAATSIVAIHRPAFGSAIPKARFVAREPTNENTDPHVIDTVSGEIVDFFTMEEAIGSAAEYNADFSIFQQARPNVTD